MDQSDPRPLIIARARHLINRAHYERLAQPYQAPVVVNCLTLVGWSYQATGFILPPTLALVDLGEGIPIAGLEAGDLIFTSGWQSYLNHQLYGDIGHVGLVTGEGTVIHATRRVRQGRSGVYEDPLENFIADGAFRVARRLLVPTPQPACLPNEAVASPH